LKIKFIDLFCGCGGLTEGFLQNPNYILVEGIDNDKDSIETYNLNHKGHGILLDIKDYEPDAEIDLLVGGPPCQGFSTLGKRNNGNPNNGLWRYYFKVLDSLRPKAFLLENVPPFYNSEQYKKLVRKLKKSGYLFTISLIDAADLGVPQHRRRVFVYGGLREEIPPISLTHASEPENGLKKHRTVKFAFRGLPLATDEKNWHFTYPVSKLMKRRYSHIPPGGGRESLPMRLRPSCWRKEVSGARDVLGRLWCDRPSVTIRTRYYMAMTGRYVHPSEDRPISFREGMRLQTFRDKHKWSGSRASVGCQVGNAVPPKVAKAFADHFEMTVFS